MLGQRLLDANTDVLISNLAEPPGHRTSRPMYISEGNACFSAEAELLKAKVRLISRWRMFDSIE